eukprot:m.47176 g.47176  ORF g.47176 m.47176 type:complete len:129 (+) comp13207_c0_seq1:71-457(+)
MEFVQTYFTQQLPAYLQQLPIPDSFGGFLELSTEEALQIAPLFVLLFSLVLMMVLHLLPTPSSNVRHNTSIRLSESKVVDKETVNFKGDKIAICRCWKSKKFPYCDGSHGAHNKATGDNLGPFLVTKS